jgi:flagella basal body P-ring formation protein FlgA
MKTSLLTNLRCGLALLLCAGMMAIAAVASASLPADLSARLRLFLDQQPLPFDGEVEVVVGEPDSRLNLAACARYEPFIPSGTRLWGKTSLGMRCVEGANWTAFVPVQVKVFGPALVAARPVARGQMLGADDLRMERVEWSQWAPGVLAVAPDQAEGRIATRGIQPGEALRRDMLRTPPEFLAGEPVRVIYSGTGFAVNAEGKALTQGTAGQSAQAALVGGRVVTGVVRTGKILEIR